MLNNLQERRILPKLYREDRQTDVKLSKALLNSPLIIKQAHPCLMGVQTPVCMCFGGGGDFGSLIIPYLIIFDNLVELGVPRLPRLATQDPSVPASPGVGFHTHAAVHRF